MRDDVIVVSVKWQLAVGSLEMLMYDMAAIFFRITNEYRRLNLCDH